MIGKVQHLVLQDLDGKFVMEWKLLNSHIVQMAGFECKPVSVELTYGLERICMFTQQKNVYDLQWNNEGIKYKDVFHQAENNFQLITLNMQIQIICLRLLIC